MSFALGFQTGTYPMLMDGKFLLGVIVGLFPIVGPAPLWVARCVVAIFSIISCAACIAIGKYAFSSRTGLLAGLVYAVLPYAVYFERQFLADPLMASFGSLAIFFTLVFARTRRWRFALFLSIAIVLAFYAKLFGGVYALVLPCAALTLTTWLSFSKSLTRFFIAGMLTALVWLLFTAIMFPQMHFNPDNRFQQQNVGFIACPSIICGGNIAGQFDQFKLFGSVFTDATFPYLGFSLLALSLLALPLSKRKKGVMFLMLSTLTMISVFAFTVKGGLPPRYLMFIVLPIVVLAAQAIIAIAQRLTNSPFRFLAPALIFGAAVSVPAANSAAIIVNISKANLAVIDWNTHFIGEDGTGSRDAVFEILARERKNGISPVIVVDKMRYLSVMPYIDRTRIDLRNTQFHYDAIYTGDVVNWIRQNQDVYILAEANPDHSLYLPPEPFLAQLLTEEVGYFPKIREHNETVVSVRRIVGMNAALSQKVFTDEFLNPSNMKTDYQALIASLGKQTDTALVLYPPHQTEVIAPFINRESGITLLPVGETFPLDPITVTSALTKLAVGHERVGVVLLDEGKGDAKHFLETWLNTNLFQINQQWFGAVRLITYTPNTSASNEVNINARFGDSISLNSYSVLDTKAKAGDLIRVRLNWQAASVPEQSFKVFAHIFAGESIIAQHDGQPVGELRPTTTWQRGEKIIDQFAIRIPDDVQAGEYKLRIGLYDMATLERLKVGDSDALVLESIITIK